MGPISTTRRSVLAFGPAGFESLSAGVRPADQQLHLEVAAEQRFVAATANGGRTSTRVDDVEQLCAWDATEHDAGTAIPGQFASLRLEVLVHVVLAPDPTPADVDAVWRVGLLRRRAALTHDEFVQHYLSRHVPMVMSRGPLFDAYTVSVVVDPEATGWDAVVRQRFASMPVWAEHDRLVMEDKPEIREDLGRFVGDLVSFEGRAATAARPT